MPTWPYSLVFQYTNAPLGGLVSPSCALPASIAPCQCALAEGQTPVVPQAFSTAFSQSPSYEVSPAFCSNHSIAPSAVPSPGEARTAGRSTAGSVVAGAAEAVVVSAGANARAVAAAQTVANRV